MPMPPKVYFYQKCSKCDFKTPLITSDVRFPVGTGNTCPDCGAKLIDVECPERDPRYGPQHIILNFIKKLLN